MPPWWPGAPSLAGCRPGVWPRTPSFPCPLASQLGRRMQGGGGSRRGRDAFIQARALLGLVPPLWFCAFLLKLRHGPGAAAGG